MNDREKVIEHLADCVEYLNGDSSRHWVFVRGNAVRAALQLLKAQESSVPSVPAVPLDKLCEWLSDNAYMYLTEKELDSGYSSHDPAYWEMKLSKWMEEQDAR